MSCLLIHVLLSIPFVRYSCNIEAAHALKINRVLDGRDANDRRSNRIGYSLFKFYLSSANQLYSTKYTEIDDREVIDLCLLAW